MDVYDRLEIYEVQIKKCEHRIRTDDFNNIIHLTAEIITALEIKEQFALHRQRLKNRLSDVSGYAGTTSRDLATLRAFDYHKRTLLNTIQRVKKQINEIELEL
jgi:hypothetical protein